MDTKQWFTAAELAGIAGMPSTDRNVRLRAEREGWTTRDRERGKGFEYALASLPLATQAALLLRLQAPLPALSPGRGTRRLTDEQRQSAWARYERLPDNLKAMAQRRLRALNSVDALLAHGQPLMAARAAVAGELQREGVRGASSPSIARWQADVAGAPRSDWLALLAPAYVGRIVTASIEPEAWELFKADYLRLEQPSATSCYDRLRRIAAQRGWTLPALRTFVRRLEREIARPVLVLAREGEEALMRLYPAQERDRSHFAAVEGVNADGHRFDVFVRFPDGEIGRPCLIGWQDLSSGKLLGYRLCDHESSDAVRLSLCDVVTTYGVPAHAWLDNGRAFAAKWMTGGTPNRYRFKVRDEDPVGIMVGLGIQVHWVTPYHGQAKPIERAWRDLCDRIAKHPTCAGAYTGNNPTAKPENYGSTAVAWDVFEALVADEIAQHNARLGRRGGSCAGRSFDQVFAEGYARATVRKASAEQLRTLLLAAEAVTANAENGSVHLSGNRYWCEALSPYAGQKVVLRFDPRSLHTSVSVYALDGRFIADAECIAAVGFADANAAREHARETKRFRRATKDALKAERRMAAAQVVAQLPATPPAELPPAAAIAPIFGKHGAKPAPPVERELARTGTDNGKEHDLNEFLKRIQEKRLREQL